MSPRVLIIDDEDLFREDLALLLADNSYECQTAVDGQQGIEKAAEFGPDIILCDIKMPVLGGIDALDHLVHLCPQACILMITANGTLDTAVEAFRKGASDYILKPLVLDDVLNKIAHYLEHRRLSIEVQILRREVQRADATFPIVGQSDSMRHVFELIDKMAQTDSTVLIGGESGTGKELVARAIHDRGPSNEQAFVAVNCAALPETLMESELFGHVKGAFTGAHEHRQGLFEMADGGTLFLDEITEMPPSLQAKLLRVIEQKEVRRLGDTRTIQVQPRIVAASNRDLKSEVASGQFRTDLFYRLRVLEITLPPLRERREDIPLLVDNFIRKYNAHLNKHCLGADADAMRILMIYSWPGNVRELENTIERAMILTSNEFLGVMDLHPDIAGAVQFPELQDDLRQAMRAYESEHIRHVLSECDGNREETARRLGVNPSTLYRKMNELAIQGAD
ncbi:MAG: DNA-binding NtrC family response regulator [Candidatus Latescibacterota bacterium]|jgi:DNA-binding NtrC family response regulator